jgi:hypothetical protein
MATRRPGAWLLVLAGGIVAGTLDILYACAFRAVKLGVPARRILQSVAAGLLGEAAFEGGRLRVEGSPVDRPHRGRARAADRHSHRMVHPTGPRTAATRVYGLLNDLRTPLEAGKVLTG